MKLRQDSGDLAGEIVLVHHASHLVGPTQFLPSEPPRIGVALPGQGSAAGRDVRHYWAVRSWCTLRSMRRKFHPDGSALRTDPALDLRRVPVYGTGPVATYLERCVAGVGLALGQGGSIDTPEPVSPTT